MRLDNSYTPQASTQASRFEEMCCCAGQSGKANARADARSEARAERDAARSEARQARTEARTEARDTRDTARSEARDTRDAARTEAREARDQARQDARGMRPTGPMPMTPTPPTTPTTPTTDGQILGGTTAPGAVIDPVLGDFTRDGGDVPIANIGIEDLGTNADGLREVKINFTNAGPEGGTFLTPPFVAVQDGTFDIYDRGGAAPEFLERLAEDGTTDDILAAFEGSGANGASGVITGPDGLAAGPLDPGETGSITLAIDPTKSQFLSFASMVIPSNDAFISSPGDPRGIRIFDEHGNFVAEDINVTGNNVLDAGTEVNTEQDAAFLNQSAPNTGQDEGGVVTVHPGFIGSEGLPATDQQGQQGGKPWWAAMS